MRFAFLTTISLAVGIAADHRAAARAIESRLITEYRLSEFNPGRPMLGAMVIITKPGLEASPVAVNPTAGATWEHGYLKPTFSTTGMGRNLLIPVMPGQRAFITKIEAKETHILFDLMLPEPINGVHFRTTVHFDFGKGYLESPDFALINRTIPEVLQIDQPMARPQRQPQRPPQYAPPPSYSEPPPPPSPPQASVPPSPPQPPPAEPRHTVEIVPGMAMQQVKAAMGSPDRVVKLGSKEIQFFGKLKVTFVNGKVADVE